MMYGMIRQLEDKLEKAHAELLERVEILEATVAKLKQRMSHILDYDLDSDHQE